MISAATFLHPRIISLEVIPFTGVYNTQYLSPVSFLRPIIPPQWFKPEYKHLSLLNIIQTNLTELIFISEMDCSTQVLSRTLVIILKIRWGSWIFFSYFGLQQGGAKQGGLQQGGAKPYYFVFTELVMEGIIDNVAFNCTW